MALQMNQLGGLGQAATIASILGPVAVGGADIYRTYSDSQQNRSELKQREHEFQALSKLYEKQAVSTERQQALAAAASIRQAQIRQAYQARYAPYFLGAAAIGALALVALGMTKGGRGGR